MRYRELGRTGIAVSEIGFGGWGIGGPTDGATSYGHTDDAVSRAALERAFELGITFYDTAPAYGCGHSERLIGAVFRNRRDRVVIATKAGYERWDHPPDFSPAGVRQALEGSLKRLDSDHVDLLQLHSIPPALLTEDLVAVLHRLRDEGKIRGWGVSPKAPADAVAAIEKWDAPVVQVNLNMMDTRAVDGGLLDLARARGTGVIARTPLCFGFLSGGIDENTRFAPEDHRSAWPRAQIEAWVRGGRRVLEAAGPGDGRPGHTALRFCLSFPAVSCTIPGILTPREAEQNALASDLGPLDAAARDRVLDINRTESFFVRRG